MKRDTKIAGAVFAAVPLLVLALALGDAWAIAHGASMQWRLLFRGVCHGIPNRCLQVWGVPMPICARCTAIYAGLFAGLAVFPLVSSASETILRKVLYVMIVPLAVDGVTQALRLRQSTNDLRLATGLAAGIAFGVWVLSAIERREVQRFTTS